MRLETLERAPRGGGASGGARLARALGFPLAAYLLSRAMVLVAAHFVGYLHAVRDPGARALRVLGSWDGTWYRAIVEHGYPSVVETVGGRAEQSAIAFFPLYPLTVKAANLVSPFGQVETMVLVATLFGAVATCLVWAVTASLVDRAAADRAALLFCFLPGAFVFSFAYAESLMLCLAIGCVWALDRRHWVLAGLSGALATLTRPNAIVLLACAIWAAVAAIRRDREWRALIAPVLVPLGMLGYLVYASVHTGEVGAWYRVQHEGWNETIDLGWGVVSDFFNFIFAGQHGTDRLIIFLSTLTVVAGVWLLVKARLPAVYNIYAIGILIVALTSANLSARPRFVLTAFPLAIAAAKLLRREAYWAVIGCAAGALPLLVIWYGWKTGNLPP